MINLGLRRFRRCHRKGHDWFPGDEPREFIPVQNICLRCQATQTRLPWGTCWGDHPIAEHYRGDDPLIPEPVGDCPSPL